MKKVNLNLATDVNMFTQESSRKKVQNQIFWTKSQIKDFQDKVRLAGEKIR